MKEQIISIKTELLLSENDQKALKKTLELERDIWNFCSKIQWKTKNLKLANFHNDCYYAVKNKFKSAKSQLIIKSITSCLSAYRSIKTNKIELKKAAEKKNLSSRYDRYLFKFKNNQFILSTTYRRITCDFVKYDRLMECLLKYKFSGITISCKNNRFFVCISFKVEYSLPTKTKVVGVDLGIRRYVATSEGNLFFGKEYNKNKRRLRYLKRCLKSKSDKGSRSAKKHLQKLKRKEINHTKNFIHNLANEILKTKATVIVLEDLTGLKKNIKKIKRYKNLNKISQVPFFLLKQILTYKAHLLNKQVITVSPSYTSQIDHKTQKLEGERKGCRFYSKSGQVYDADLNASINIALRSKLPISSCEGLDGQGEVIHLNVS